MTAQSPQIDRKPGSGAPERSPSGAPEPADGPPNGLAAADDEERGAERRHLPAHLEPLAETARDYAKASAAENTRKAYASDWRHYAGWTRRHGFAALPPDPQIIGLYVAACASGALSGRPSSVATIERRLSALRWNFTHLS